MGYIKQMSIPITIMDRIKYFFGIIKIEKFSQGIVIQMPKKEKEKYMNKIYRKLENKLQCLKIKMLVFSDNLSNGENCFQTQFLDKLRKIEYKENAKLISGRETIEYMQFDIWKYILEMQTQNMKNEDIYFLIKKDARLDLSFLSAFIKESRTVNIVTNDIERFKKIQENLYENENILISVSNNKMKALKRAKYIINVNMSQKEIEKFKINKYAIILHIKEKIKYDENGFEGININDIKIKIPDEYIECFEKINDETDKFSNIKLYEIMLLLELEKEREKSYIKSESNIKKMYFDLADKVIKKDDIKILKLIGNRGEIQLDELIQNRNIYETMKK